MRRLWPARSRLALSLSLLLFVAMEVVALGQRASVADDRSLHQLREIVVDIGHTRVTRCEFGQCL